MLIRWYSRDGMITVVVALYFMAVGTDIMLTIDEYKTHQTTTQSTEKTVLPVGDIGIGIGIGGEGGEKGKGGGRGRGRQATKEPAAPGITEVPLPLSASPKRKQKQKQGTLR